MARGATVRRPGRRTQSMETISCPSCGSAKVTKLGHPDHLGLDVIRCEACLTQFTVQTDRA